MQDTDVLPLAGLATRAPGRNRNRIAKDPGPELELLTPRLSA